MKGVLYGTPAEVGTGFLVHEDEKYYHIYGEERAVSIDKETASVYTIPFYSWFVDSRVEDEARMWGEKLKEEQDQKNKRNKEINDLTNFLNDFFKSYFLYFGIDNKFKDKNGIFIDLEAARIMYNKNKT